MTSEERTMWILAILLGLALGAALYLSIVPIGVR
jgi:hypothetical protein